MILASSTICLELTTVLETSNAHVQLLELGRHGRLALEPTAMDLIMANMDRGSIGNQTPGDDVLEVRRVFSQKEACIFLESEWLWK